MDTTGTRTDRLGKRGEPKAACPVWLPGSVDTCQRQPNPVLRRVDALPFPRRQTLTRTGSQSTAGE